MRTVGPDEFKQALLKSMSKQAKAERTFAVIGISLQNADTIARLAGDDALDRLARAVRSAIARQCTAQELLCAVSERCLLVLHPEADAGAVTKQADRLSEILSAISITGTPLRPAFEVGVGESAGLLDVNALLLQLGCELDEHGDLREAGERSRQHRGDLQRWLQRYDLRDDGLASDAWTKTSVMFRRIDLGGSGQDTRQALLKHAKAMQAIEHAAIVPLIDFWLGDDQFICVERDFDERGMLEQWRGAHKSESLQLYFEWAGQYLSMLLYLQTLTPPVVLDVSAPIVVSANKKLSLTGYAYDVLRKIAAHAAPKASEAAYVQLFRAFADRLDVAELKELARNSDLTTLHKIRAAMKHHA